MNRKKKSTVKSLKKNGIEKKIILKYFSAFLAILTIITTSISLEKYSSNRSEKPNINLNFIFNFNKYQINGNNNHQINNK